ncbi:hypothetical protein PC116_g20508 [Phytophthora cactorum]|nr:hypothetical protein PC116_g20508 [Phytophthora cactorum]
MVHKYVRIRDAAKHFPAVEELLPRLSDHRRILVLHDKLKELQSVCEKLQQHKRTLAVIKVTSSPPVTSAETKTLEPFRPPDRRRAVDYIPLLGAIPLTSNRCERLFSEC